jgi:hypothetical protein
MRALGSVNPQSVNPRASKVRISPRRLGLPKSLKGRYPALFVTRVLVTALPVHLALLRRIRNRHPSTWFSLGEPSLLLRRFRFAGA